MKIGEDGYLRENVQEFSYILKIQAVVFIFRIQTAEPFPTLNGYIQCSKCLRYSPVGLNNHFLLF